MAERLGRFGSGFWFALFAICGLLSESAWSLAESAGMELLSEQRSGNYVIDSQTSEIQVLVYRSGALARLGHNHVIGFANISGEIVLGATLVDSSVNLVFAVAESEVDQPEARRAAGDAAFGEVGEKARAGTRKNMLGEALLNAEKFPVVNMNSIEIFGVIPNLALAMEIGIVGQVIPMEVDAVVEFDSGNLVATGVFQVRQSDLGLKPLKLLLGLLAVRDEMDVMFRIHAIRKERFNEATRTEIETITP